MELISDGKQLTVKFKELITHYDEFYCVVAWAGYSDKKNAMSLLIHNKNKIKKAIFGLSFHHTHPKFIKEFITNDNVRFIKDSSDINTGILHDKIYLFVNSQYDWSAIIGSSNFTEGGFFKNSECNILISNTDNGSEKVFRSLKNKIEATWETESYLKEEDLNEYREAYLKIKKSENKLHTDKSIYKNGITTLKLNFYNMSWGEYHRLLEYRKQDTDERLKVLNNISVLFDKYKSFGDMTPDDRAKIFGKKDVEVEYSLFGTNANGKLRKRIVEGDSQFVEAIDSIPLKGEITKVNYKEYLDKFCNLQDPENKVDQPLAATTRLLAMKRPDVFICVNNKNKKNLKEYLGFPENITLKNYWEVIEKIRQLEWYKYDGDNKKTDLCWKFRVALLDTLLYEE